MILRLAGSIALAVGLLFGSTAAGAGQEIMFACTGADGSVSLGNSPSGDNCQQIGYEAPVAATPAQAATPPATAKQAKAAPKSDPPQKADANASADGGGDVPPLETRLSNYRDAMLQGAARSEGAPPAALNPAVNRRYRMMNRSAYQASH